MGNSSITLEDLVKAYNKKKKNTAPKYKDICAIDGVLTGTNGNDVFHVTENDITTTVKSATKGSDILLLEGFNAEDVESLTFSQRTDESGATRDLVITIDDNRTVTVENYFTSTAGNATKSSLKTIRLEIVTDGETKLYKDFNIIDMCVIDYNGTFTPKKNKVTGTVFNDTIDMSAQTKKLTINGGNGNDVITGGLNNDTVTGGKGVNTFIYNEGSGSDTIKLTKGENLTIKYISDAALTKDDFLFTEKGKDVVITRTYTDAEGNTKTDKLTVKDMTKNNLAERIVFETGSDADDTDEIFNLREDYYTIDNGKTKVNGSNLSEYIYGTQKSDTIKGNGGDDIIDAGVGNDKLYGGVGSDTFVFDTYELGGRFYGSGKDTIMDVAEDDILQFTNSKIESLTFSRYKKDLIITYYDKEDKSKLSTENSVTVKDYYATKSNTFKTFKIAALDENGNLKIYSNIKDIIDNVVRDNNGDIIEDITFTSYIEQKREIAEYKTDKEKLENYENLSNFIFGTSGDESFNQTNDNDVFVPNGGDDTVLNANFDKDKMMLTGNIEDVSYTRYNQENDLYIDYKDGSVLLKDYFKDSSNLNTLVINGEEFKISETLFDKLTIIHNETTEENCFENTDYKDVFEPNSEYATVLNANANDKLKINDSFENMMFGRSEDKKDLIIYYNNNHNYVTVKDWFTDLHNHINSLVDSTGEEYNISIDANYKNTILGTNSTEEFSYLPTSANITPGQGRDNVSIISEGAHTINFTSGDGNAYIYSGGSQTSSGRQRTSKATDSVLNFNNLNIEDLTFVNYRGYGLEIQYGENESVYFPSFFRCANDGIGKLAFNGELYDKSILEILSEIPGFYTGTDSANNIYVAGENAIVDAKKGNDYIYNYGNKTEIDAGLGNDCIYLYGNDENVIGNKGTDEYMIYSNGIHTLNFSAGDGSDTIYYSEESCSDGLDIILNFKNINFNDLSFLKDSSNNLVIQYSSTTSDKITLSCWLQLIARNGDDFSTTIQTEDGTHNLYEVLMNNGGFGIVNEGSYVGTSGNDMVCITGANAEISTGQGEDTIYICSDAVNNLKFSTGDGTNTIYAGEYRQNTYSEYYSGGSNTVLNFTDVHFSDLFFEYSLENHDNFNLKIKYSSNADDYVILKNWLSDSNKINTIHTLDGTYLLSDIGPYGTNNNLHAYIKGDNVSMSTKRSQTFLYICTGGDHTININKSSGQINIYAGGSSYGDGSDTILNFNDITFDDLIFTYTDYKAPLNIQYGDDSNDYISVYNWFNNNEGYINKIAFNGELYEKTLFEIVSERPDIYHGTDGDDNIYLKTDNVTVTPGKRNDRIYIKSDGEHIINFTTGDGHTDVYAGYSYFYDDNSNYADGTNTILNFTDLEFDQLIFKSNSYGDLSIQYGTNSSDYITLPSWFFNSGNVNTVKTTDGTHSISDELNRLNLGLATNDYIGTNGADNIFVKDTENINNLTIVGGKGDDDFNIGGKNNTLIFTSGDGNDRVTATSLDNSSHILKFIDTIDDMTFSAGGNDLIIAYTEEDSVTLTDWFASDNVINKVVCSDDTSYSETLEQLHSEVSAWMSEHTDYATVSEALASDDADVAQLQAYFNLGV